MIQNNQNTMEFSRELIHFLDTIIKLRDRTLYTDVYCKPTDSHSYLFYNSSHPYHCKKSIPYRQLLRIRQICSSLTDFDKHASDFASYFQNRGYSNHLIEEAYIKVRRMDRNQLLDRPRTHKDVPSEDTTFLVSTYHPHDQTVLKIISTNWDFLGKIHNTTFLHKKNVMNAFQRPQNLGDILVCTSTSRNPVHPPRL